MSRRGEGGSGSEELGGEEDEGVLEGLRSLSRVQDRVEPLEMRRKDDGRREGGATPNSTRPGCSRLQLQTTSALVPWRQRYGGGGSQDTVH